jgi:hypothetical protein
MTRRKWDPNNPEDTVTPKEIETMTDEEVAEWDRDCDRYNRDR